MNGSSFGASSETLRSSFFGRGGLINSLVRSSLCSMPSDCLMAFRSQEKQPDVQNRTKRTVLLIWVHPDR